MKFRSLAVAALLVFATSLVLADATNPPVTVAPNPATWGTLSDGGGGPIDGTVDWMDVNGSVIAGYSSTTPEIFRGFFEFSLNNYNLTTVTATLRLQAIFMSSSSSTLQLYGYNGDGQITAADFSRGTLLSSFSVPSLGAVDLDVSDFVSDAFANGDDFVGFNIRPTGDDGSLFYFGHPVFGPSSTLIMSATMVPEPQVLGLLSVGMILMLRKQRSS